MPDLLDNRITLGGLYLLALAKGFLRYRNPYRRTAWRHRAAFYQRAWREAAEELGATCRPLGGEFLEIALGDRVTRVNDNSSAIDDPVTLEVLSDKALTYELIEAEGVPTPSHRSFSLRSLAPATAFLNERAGRGCVVKPVRGTGGGRGITAGVRTRGHLARAAAAAAIYCDDLLIEEQVAGDNYRLLYLDGQLIDAFVRQPPAVTGDGRSTIAALVHHANDQRLRAGSGRSQVLLTVDLDLRRTLAQQGLSMRSVPAEGRRVVLKTVVNENCGDDNTGAARMLHPSIVAICARAVGALRVRLAGVDVITPDPSVPLAEAGGVVLEVNAPPNFYYHYHQRDGVFPVALHVLKRLLVADAPVQAVARQQVLVP